MPDVAFGLASPDGEHVFLVVAKSIEENQALGLNAAIYKMDGRPVTALQPVGERIDYDILNEVEIFSYRTSRLIPPQWSPDGQRLVFADPLGNLWIMDVIGKTTLLASNLPGKDWHERAWFSWIGDGRFLLARRGVNAWIANVQLP